MHVIFGLKNNPVDMFLLSQLCSAFVRPKMEESSLYLFTKPYLSSSMIKLLHTHPGGPGGPGGPVGPGTPRRPSRPLPPGLPFEPVLPETPLIPLKPFDPLDPRLPGEPVSPIDPGGPFSPWAPRGPGLPGIPFPSLVGENINLPASTSSWAYMHVNTHVLCWFCTHISWVAIVYN